MITDNIFCAYRSEHYLTLHQRISAKGNQQRPTTRQQGETERFCSIHSAQNGISLLYPSPHNPGIFDEEEVESLEEPEVVVHSKETMLSRHKKVDTHRNPQQARLHTQHRHKFKTKPQRGEGESVSPLLVAAERGKRGCFSSMD